MQMVDIGQSVRAARKQARMTQDDLARIAGVSRVRIVEMESGRAADMRMSNVLRVLEAVGLEMKIGPIAEARPSFEDIMSARDDLYDTPGMG